MKKKKLLFLSFALLIFGITSYYSSFFHHYDEHFQIIEYAQFINGDTKLENLAWEYEAHIRPSLQPYLAAYTFRFLDVLGLTNHFTQAFILRVLSTLFLFFCLGVLYKTLEKDFETKKMKWIFLVCTFLLYFIPFISVRFSSETWSSAFFILGFCVLYKQLISNNPIQAKKIFLTGIYFGISFLFRYQSAILIFGVAAFLMIYRINDFKNWLIMFAGFVAIFIFGVLLDRAFYGEWTISALGYFTTNLIDNKAAEYGVSPWYWYIQKFIGVRAIMFLNSFIVLSFLLFFIFKRNHILTWCTLIFILVHFGIGHKEMRFLFPIAFFIPYFLAQNIQNIHKLIRDKPILLNTSKVLLLGLLVINFGALISNSIYSAHSYQKHSELIAAYKDQPSKVYFFNYNFSFLNKDEQALKTSFYDYEKHNATHITPGYMDTLLQTNNFPTDTLIFALIPDTITRWNSSFEFVGKPTEDWIEKLNHNNVFERKGVHWALYKLKR